MSLRHEELERRELLAANLLADINQLAKNSSNAREFTKVGELTFFVAETELGTELWKTDGTDGGTALVRDIRPGPASSLPHDLVPVGDTLLFHVADEVWRSDGTEAGTLQLNGLDRILAVTKSHAITANGFITDGTLNGAVPVSGPEGQHLKTLEVGVVTDDTFFMRFSGRYHAIEESGRATMLTRDSRVQLIHVNDQSLMMRSRLSRTEVLDANGEVAAILPGQLVDPGHYVDAGGLAYFETKVGSSIHLWRTSGDLDGTFVVGEFSASAIDQIDNTTIAASLLTNAEIGSDTGRLWFVATDDRGSEVWTSDGSREGTKRVKDIFQGQAGSTPTDLFASDDKLWFVANDGVSGRQVWSTDGTEAGTKRVTLLAKPLFDDSAEPTILGATDQVVFFRADSETLGNELWISDGTVAAERILNDIQPGPLGSYPTGMFAHSSDLLLFTATGPEGNELWKTDGTQEGTQLVHDVHDQPGNHSSNPNEFVNFQDHLYFVANDGVHGSELWMYDGAKAVMVSDIWSGPQGSAPKGLTVVDDKLVFSANDGTRGRELWQADRFGATLLSDITPGEMGSNPEQLTLVGDRLYFAANIGANVGALRDSPQLSMRRGLYGTDGREVTLEVEPAEAGRRPAGTVDQLTSFDGSLFFYELEAQNGSSMRVHRITPGGATDVINEETRSGYRGLLAIATNGQFLVFAGSDPDAPRDNGLFSVLPGEDPVPLSLSQRLLDEDRVVIAGDDILFYNRRSAPALLDGTVDGTIVRRRDMNVVEAIPLGDQTLYVENAGTTQILWLGDLRESEVDQIARFPSPLQFTKNTPQQLTELNGDVYFVVDHASESSGSQLWMVDGATHDVSQMTSFGPTSIGASPNFLFAFQDQLIFAADDGVHGRELFAVRPETIAGDISGDGELDSRDIDALFAATRRENPNPEFDLNDDGEVSLADVDVLIDDVLQIKRGDSNLDGRVDFLDFLALSRGFLKEDGAVWDDGDFTGDGKVTLEDFLILADNFEF